MNDSVLLKSALKYATAFGWPVFPLAPRSKFPMAGSHGCKDATNDPDVIRQWWEKTPNANIGLATGIVNWVLDVDPRNGGEESLEALEAKYGRLNTVQQISGGGGRHYVWHKPEGIEIRNGQIAPGLDVKGFGGYILLAPSVHPETGRLYDWDGADRLENQKIQPAPEWLIKLVTRNDRATAHPQHVSADASVEALAGVLATGWPEHGKRHEAFLAIAGACAHAGVPQDDAQALVEALYRELWPKDPWIDEARREVSTTYDTFTGGGKITGLPKLRQLGADRTVLRVASIWMKNRALAEEDAKADATAAMEREERWMHLNANELFSKSQPVLRWKEFAWQGKKFRGVIDGGEYVVFQSVRELSRYQEASERILGDLRIKLVHRSTTRDKAQEWAKVVREMMNLANDRDWTRERGIELDIEDAVICLFEAAEKPFPKTVDDRHKILASLVKYRRFALPDGEAPPAVFRWEGLCHVHTSTLRRWLGTPAGAGRYWPLHELEEGLTGLGFKYNDEPMESVRDGERIRIAVMSGPLSVLDLPDDDE